jgi:hypothetical protein
VRVEQWPVKCGNSDSAVIACSPELCEKGVNKSNHPIQNPSISHAQPPRLENMYLFRLLKTRWSKHIVNQKLLNIVF